MLLREDRTEWVDRTFPVDSWIFTDFWRRDHMGVEPKIGVGYPQIIHFNRVFHYKPSILGYPYFWKHSYIFLQKGRLFDLCECLVMSHDLGFYWFIY